MLIDLKYMFKDMLSITWPILLISIVTIVSFRITEIIIKKEKFVLYKELLKLVFLTYILCLFQIVTSKDINSMGINLIPFREMFRYDIGSYLFYKNILGNLLLFLPFGFFISYFLKFNKVYIIIILSLITSFSIEITQLYIGRVFDVDDIILNVLGSIIGYIIYKIINKLEKKIPSKLKKDFIIDILIIIIIILAVRYVIL